MAKKSDSDQQVDPIPEKRRGPGRPTTDKKVIVSTAIAQSRFDAIKQVAQDNGIPYTRLVAFLILHGLDQIEKGKLKLPVETVTQLKLP